MSEPHPQTTRLLPRLFLALTCVGLLITALLAPRTFPAALIDLSIGRVEAQERALAFLRERGARLEEGWQTTGFAAQTTAQDYLLAVGGFSELEALSKRDLNLAHWRVRLFRPLEPEEWSVTVSSRTGRVIGFEHIIPAEAPGATLSYTDAQQLALQALAARPGADLIPSELRLLAHRVIRQPNRTDHTFIWEQPALRRGEASYRYTATVHGDAIGSLAEYYHIPESWSRLERWHMRRGALLNSIGWMLTFALLAGLGFTWLWAARRQILRRRFAVTLLAAVAVVGLATALNSIPLSLRSYPTNVSPTVFILAEIGANLNLLSNIVVAVVVAGMAGEALLWSGSGRPAGSLSLSRIFTRAGLSSRPVVRSLLIGICVGLAQLGYLSLFYWLGMRWFGVWQPITPSYDDALSTPFPWLYAMALGLLPAVAEELVFRLGGITLLQRVTGMPRLAVIATAIIWAALHTTYAQRPFFIRLIELTIVGIAFGILFLRYGILSSMAAHYTYNASLLLPLLIQGSWATRLGGVLALSGAGLLLLPALWRALRRRPLEDAAALAASLPEAEPRRPKPPAPYLAMRHTQLPLALALAGALAWLIGTLLLRYPPLLDRSLTREAALERASEAIDELGLSTAGLFGAAAPVEQLVNLDLDYLRAEPGNDDVAGLIASEGQRALWSVSFRGWDRDDWLLVKLGARGEILSFERGLPEDAPAASLSREAAEAFATSLLYSRDIDTSGWSLVESTTITRPHRVDHRFVWQADRVLGKAAQPRVLVTVQGDQASGFTPYLYVPPEYSRERERRTLPDLLSGDLLPALPDLAAFVLGAACLILSLRRSPPLKLIAGTGIVGGVVTLIERLLLLTTAQLAQPPELIWGINNAFFAAILAGAELGLIAGGAALLWSSAYPKLAPLERQLAALMRIWQSGSSPLWRDARLLALALLPALLIFEILEGYLAPAGAVRSPAGLNSLFPAVSVVAAAARTALRNTLLLAGATALFAACGLRWAALPLSTLAALLVAAAPNLPIGLILIAWPAALIAAALLRANLVALALALWSAACLPDALMLLSLSHTWYQVHGMIILLLLVPPYLPALRSYRTGREQAGAGSPG
ncbi:MAG: hypothetical protein KatS3mg057_1117 [Herpetosiphonaceae bacterium]|nr:MAG: hypothetical protein KatS3mg057_1117 [Herpetosiphonaceae bacterium]